jgi:hypothetical protein
MTQSQALKRLRRSHWRGLQRLLVQAYQEGFDAGLSRAHGQGRRGRTIRGDSTVAGLVEQVERHFGLERFAFEVRVVHRESGRRVPATDLIRRYRVAE